MDTIGTVPKYKPPLLEKPYQCNICAVQFTLKNNLYRHVKRIHHGEKKANKKIGKYECNICYNNYSSNCYLKKHIQVVHNNSAQVKCGHCGKIFKSKSSLHMHLKYMHGFGEQVSREFICDYCKRSYNKKTNLQYHIVNWVCLQNPMFGTERGTVTCGLCNCILVKNSLRTHIKVCKIEGNKCKGTTPVVKLRSKRRKLKKLEKEAISSDTDVSLDTNQQSSITNLRKNNTRKSSRKKNEINYRKLIESWCEEPNEIQGQNINSTDIKTEPDVKDEVEGDFKYVDIPGPVAEARPNEDFEKVFHSNIAFTTDNSYVKRENDREGSGDVFSTSVSQYLFMMLD